MGAAAAGTNEDEAAVERVLRSINRAWMEGQTDDLAAFFHEDVVIVQPRWTGTIVGRAACVQSYKDFASHAVLHGCELSDFDVDVWGTTSVASYRFDITYEMQGKRLQEIGRDLFVLEREAGAWRVVWRTLIVEQPGS